MTLDDDIVIDTRIDFFPPHADGGSIRIWPIIFSVLWIKYPLWFSRDEKWFFPFL